MSESAASRRTPLHAEHLALGAKMVDFAGWAMPVLYRGVIEEHRAVRERAGLFDVSHMGQLRVSGPDAETFVQRLTPNDVTKLVPGRAHYSALLSQEGTFLDDILVYRIAPTEFLLVVNAANADADCEWIRDRPHAGVEVEDCSERYALIALQGPRAPAILARLTAVDLAAIGYYRFAVGEVDGAPAIVSRTGYTGEDGFELYVEPEHAARLWRRLLEAGADDGLAPAGLGARDTLRLEAGMTLYGHEIDRATTPFEAGLDWIVKLDKGDFVGAERLREARSEPPTKRLVGFEVAGRGIARQGYPIVDANCEHVGVVTSGTWSPTLEKAIGMAHVPAALAGAGSQLAIDIRGKRAEARVVPLPFYKRPR